MYSKFLHYITEIRAKKNEWRIECDIWFIKNISMYTNNLC